MGWRIFDQSEFHGLLRQVVIRGIGVHCDRQSACSRRHQNVGDGVARQINHQSRKTQEQGHSSGIHHPSDEEWNTVGNSRSTSGRHQEAMASMPNLEFNTGRRGRHTEMSVIPLDGFPSPFGSDHTQAHQHGLANGKWPKLNCLHVTPPWCYRCWFFLRHIGGGTSQARCPIGANTDGRTANTMETLNSLFDGCVPSVWTAA